MQSFVVEIIQMKCNMSVYVQNRQHRQYKFAFLKIFFFNFPRRKLFLSFLFYWKLFWMNETKLIEEDLILKWRRIIQKKNTHNCVTAKTCQQSCNRAAALKSESNLKFDKKMQLRILQQTHYILMSPHMNQVFKLEKERKSCQVKNVKYGFASVIPFQTEKNSSAFKRAFLVPLLSLSISKFTKLFLLWVMVILSLHLQFNTIFCITFSQDW